METQSNTQTTRTSKNNPLTKILIISLLVLAMLAGATGTAMAGPGSDEDGTIILESQLEDNEDGDPEPQIGANTPRELRRYVISYTSFYAENETGPDWPGSDEMSFLLSASFGDDAANIFHEPIVRETDEYGDVDTGETHYFTSGDRCYTPGGCHSSSIGVASPIMLTASAVEHDGSAAGFDEHFIQGLVDLLQSLGVDGSEIDEETVTGFILHGLADYYNNVMTDDHFGYGASFLSGSTLEEAMPYVGRGMTVRLDVDGWGGDWLISGDGEYVVTANIRRVADAEPEPQPSELDDVPVLVGQVAVTSATTTANGTIDVQDRSQNPTPAPGSASTQAQPTRGSGSAVGGRSLFGR